MIKTKTIKLPKTSAPAERAFINFGITKIKDFTKYSEAELLQLHGVGPKAIRMLKEELKKVGLSFRAKI